MNERPAQTLQAVMQAIDAWTFRHVNEDELQSGLAEALDRAGLQPQREVRIAGGRIDVLCGRIGVEVKVAGQPAQVVRQLTRYASGGDIDALVLVTTRVRHQAPDTISGIPVRVLCLAGRSLL